MSAITQVSQLLSRILAGLAAPQDLHYINGPDTLPAPLSPEQEKQVLSAIRHWIL